MNATEPVILAREYLAAPTNAFWCWSQDGEALETRHKKTIALRAEIAHILKRIAPGGLPPFGSLVVLLSACRDNWPEINRDISDEFLNRMSVSTGGIQALAQTREVMAALDDLHRLPVELRKGVQAKALIAQVVFENAARRTARMSPHDSKAIAQVMDQEPSGIRWAAAIKNPAAGLDLIQDLIALNGGVQLLNEYRLKMLLKTGLDAIPEPLPGIEEDEKAPEGEKRKRTGTIRELLEDLGQQQETAGLARLTRNLMAALYVPRPLSMPQELPLGGFSDISNRGPLDRLLVSELAHEDLVLSARLAMNEALFLRREAPPHPPPATRAILIDSGIRMWGIPRVYACAAALAFHALAPKHMNVQSFRAFGEGITPADLKNKEGIERHLEALSPAPHPARAMEIFLESLRAEHGRESEGLEAIFITHPGVVDDPEFRAAYQAYAQFDLGRAFITTVNRDGAFQFFALHARGKKLIRQATLPLESILNPPKPKPQERPARVIPIRAPEHDPHRPWLLSMEPLPLRIPAPVDAGRACYSQQHGLATVSRDGRLLLWRNDTYGPQELTARIPPGRLFAFWFHEKEVFVLKGMGRGHLALVRAGVDDAEEKKCAQIKFSVRNEPILAAGALPGVVFVVHRREVDLFDANTGVKLSSLNLEGRRWRRGRFFFGRAGWELLAYNGINASFILLPSPPTLKEVRTQSISHCSNPPFEREGLDGPWCLTVAGELYSLGDNQFSFKKIFPEGTHILRDVSRDGNVLHVESRPKGASSVTYAVADLVQNHISTFNSPRDLSMIESPKWGHSLQQHSRFVNIKSIGLTGNRLTFQTKNDCLFQALDIRNGPTRRLQIRRDLEIQGTPDLVPFVRSAPTPGAYFEVKCATFKSGTRMYFDSRGLLHLKSPQAERPELALVLVEGVTAGWSPETGVVGQPYFTGRDNPGNLDEFFRHYYKFLETLA